MKNIILLLYLTLLSYSVSAQIDYSTYSIGYLGGQQKVKMNTKDSMLISISGGNAITSPYINVVPDKVDLMTGFPFDVVYFPLVFENNLFVSKGYFADFIAIEWSILAMESQIERFLIYRKPLDAEGDSILVANLPPDEYSWKDEWAEKGQLYKYTIFAKGLSDDLRLPFINIVEGVGFAFPTGTASGRITYEGGTAVEGAVVMAETTGKLAGKSIHLNGADAYLNMPHVDDNNELEIRNGFTFQSWVRLGEHGGTLFSKGEQYELSVSHSSVAFRVKDATVSIPFTAPTDSFFHVTATYDPSDSLKLYVQVDEERSYKASVIAGTQPDNSPYIDIYIGRDGNGAGNYLQGYVDELRLWDIALSEEEVLRDYTRYIAGNEEHLVGYWRLNTGVADQFFDAARKGYSFYENHGWVWRAAWSEIIPLQSQLSYRGITDEDGNYFISGFPYETGGSQYTFTPMLGVHQFEPTQQLKFVGDGAAIHNGVDFRDVSAFTVTGTVWYKDTFFPVEGVSIKVDGKPAVTSDGELIETDKLGQFTIDVPIGYHALKLEKALHGFAYEGRFPAPDESTPKGVIPTFDFQEPIAGLTFFDTTRVKVTGKVVGGPVEEQKILGFGKSKNNIGNATITLNTEKGYDVTQEVITELIEEGKVSNSVKLDKKITTLYPNKETGEYVAYLLPEKYTVTHITAGDYTFGDEHQVTIDLQKTLWENEVLEDTLKIEVGGEEVGGFPPYNEAEYDSIFEVSNIDTVWTIGKSGFSFQYKKSFIYREIPTIEVTNSDGLNNFGNANLFGDTTYLYVNKELKKSESIPLVEGGAYTFGHPVFTQRKQYTMDIALFESYFNADNGLTDKVPVIDGKLEIKNDLAIDTDKQIIHLNRFGKAKYSFKGGLPEISLDNTTPANSFTKTINITAFSNDGAIKTTWRDGDPLRGYVFGGVATGNNFVTTGPTEITTILRDPPGSNSYTYLEKGTSFSSIRSWEVEETFNQAGSLSFHLGQKVKTLVGGLGAGIIKEFEYNKDITIGMESSQTWVNDFEQVITTTTTKAWSTSADPDYVGAAGDVFVGYATNIIYGKSLDLQLIPEIDCPDEDCGTQKYRGYQLGVKPGLRLSPQFTTGFIYTQGYIENTLIPNLKEVRNSILTYVQDTASVVATEKPIYISLVPPDSTTHFGSDNGDKKIWGNSTNINSVKDLGKGPSYIIKIPQKFIDEKTFYTDSVHYYNRQISQWEFWLKENEKQKVKASLFENISFDGGATYENSTTTEISTTTTSSFTWFVNPSLSFEFGQEWDGLGMSETISLGYSMNSRDTEGKEEVSESTYGFVLEDGDRAQTASGAATDYYSIDLKVPTDGFGPVFIVKGGASSCPYEGEQKTKYYVPGKYTLRNGTLQTEKPEITVEQEIIADVPENYPAEFIVYLKNNSESKEDIWYDLSVYEQSNPYGAVIEIDGSSISGGRAFMVEAGSTLQKTLRVWKGQSDVYDYEDITLLFESQCDGDIGEEISFSAYFKPGCTDIELEAPIDQWVINTETVPEDTMRIKISGYDIEQDNFEKVLFQYKPASTSTWATNMIFYNQKKVSQEDYENADEPKAWFDNAEIAYQWDMSSLPDREYDLRVVSVCVLGPGSEVETPTPAVRGIKDVKRPLLFGSPQPADGILSANDEIMIQFDEPIEAGLLTPANFSVQGVLNAYEINNNTSISLDGLQDYVKISDGLELGNKSFTIELWVRRNATNREEVIFSKGTTASDLLELGFTADNKLYIDIAGEHFATSASYLETDWHHLALVYDLSQNEFTIYRDDQYVLEGVVPANAVSGSGAIALGKSVITNNKYFNGNVHDLRIWSKHVSLSNVYANMYQHFSGLEVGLVGYWPMDEAKGKRAFDKARYRNAAVFADWEVNPKGKAFVFDGLDDYLEINTASTVVITPEMDFSIELWFKADASQSDVVLFSSGKGDGTDTLNEHSMSIGFNSQRELYLLNNGSEIVAEGYDYLDGNWHHLAISLNRLSNTNIYVDEALVKSATSDGFGGLSGAKMWIGSRGYLSSTSVEKHDKFFKGVIDEIRIWEVARRESSIELDIVSKLSGDEMGLIAYYPFESYQTQVTGNVLLDPTLTDQWKNPYGENAGLAKAFGGCDFTDDAPNLKDARPVKKVDFSWAVNEDKIIITPSAGMTAAIEKSILEIGIKRIEDKFGNRIASPILWTAYVDKNQLKWSEKSLTLENKLYNEYTFEVDVINNGGTEQSFQIDNLPPWLDAEPQVGTLAPLSFKTITFTVNEGLNTGYYSEDLFLKGDFGFDEKLHIDMRIYSKEPEWEVNPADFQYSMNVIGQLKVNGVLSSDIYDEVSAFVGDECRGVSKLTYVEEFDIYLVFLDIYSNSESGEQIELRVWNANEGTEHREVTPNYTFTANAVWGSPSTPQLIEANNTYLQTIHLQKGWNWVSFHLNSSNLADIDELFSDIDNVQGDQIKGQTVVDVYTSEYGWNGTLTGEGGFKTGNLYKVKTAGSGVVEVIGTAIDASSEILINTGWNWIGYNPRFSMDINEAFTNFNPSSGDVVKNQHAFSIYESNIGWIGSLNYLVPGEGYMFQSSNEGTLKYPEASLLNSGRIKNEIKPSPWSNATIKYSDNMSVIASIDDVEAEGFVLGAFIDGEHRGYAYPLSVHNGQILHFINIAGEANGEIIHFKALHQKDVQTYEVVNRLAFRKNGIEGSLSKPLLLSLNDGSAENDEYVVYPNPFTKTLTISVPETIKDDFQMTINDVLGREIVVFSEKDIADNGLFEWDGKDLLGNDVSTGIYFIVINSPEEKVTIKVNKR